MRKLCKLRSVFLNALGYRFIFACSILLAYGTAMAQELPGRKQVDSIRKEQLDLAKQKATLLKDTIKQFRNIAGQKKDTLSKNLKDKFLKQYAAKRAVLDSAKKNKKISVTNLGIENSTLLNTNSLNLNRAEAINNVTLVGQVKLFKVPLALDFSNNTNEFNEINPLRDGLFKMNFDRSQIQNPYKNDFNKYTRFKQNRLSGLDMADFLKKRISEKLRSAALGNLSEFPEFESVLKDKDRLNELLSLDEQQLRKRLDVLLSEQKRAGSGKVDSLSTAKKRQLQEQSERRKAEVTEVVLSLKRDMEENGLDQGRLLLVQNFISNQGSMKDLESLFENEMNQSDRTSTFSKAYSKVKKMQLGNFSQEMPGSFLNEDIMVRGLSVDVKTQRGPVTLGLGLNKDTGMPKDANFNGSLYDAPKLLTYVGVPVTNFSFGRGKISWVGGFSQQRASGFSQLNSVPKNGLAFTVSQDLLMKDLGQFTVEMSKSSTQYRNLSVNESDKMVLNQDLRMGNYFRDDVFETMSFGVKHRFDLRKFGLSSNTFVSYSGLGFQNPAQQGYGNMGLRMGTAVKKNFMKNKLVLNARGDIKNTNISATSGAHWSNYNLQLDSRFRLSRNATLNLKYAENGVDKIERGSTPVYSSHKLQADFTGNYQIGASHGFSYLSVGRQLMVNPGTVINTSFLTMNYAQSVILKSCTLSANAFYNKELSGIQILGDMLNTDFGCQYNLSKNLNVSSAVTYLDNQRIARQVGVRQTAQLSLVKNFDISAFIDLRKNLIDPLYPDLFATGRGELSIRYYLNK